MWTEHKMCSFWLRDQCVTFALASACGMRGACGRWQRGARKGPSVLLRPVRPPLDTLGLTHSIRRNKDEMKTFLYVTAVLTGLASAFVERTPAPPRSTALGGGFLDGESKNHSVNRCDTKHYFFSSLASLNPCFDQMQGVQRNRIS